MLDFIIDLLKSRGITLDNINLLVSILKKEEYVPYRYNDDILKVLSVKEIQDLISLGVTLDIYCESNILPELIQDSISNDSLFSLDKSLALSVVNIFGPEAVINFSFLQKEKSSDIKSLLKEDKVNTFLDDILCVITSAVAIGLY
ncbi:phosphatidylglycerophosphatase A [Gottschalkia purinilytica]|uniref:Phosphatidylglycerophosphatase A n=1 Tax=Gottschalkia purinilytica TaxID=1503 RepID=A0A0L0WCJ6_GOTPU|nr:hypothetical protein [Gottschalkia purinilytica]KNF09135.1 phosphatidylglycerophosphatase A [Gottschalkia purinilytica]